MRVATRMFSEMSDWMGLTMTAGGMMGSGSEGDSREYRRDKASALQLWFPGR